MNDIDSSGYPAEEEQVCRGANWKLNSSKGHENCSNIRLWDIRILRSRLEKQDEVFVNT